MPTTVSTVETVNPTGLESTIHSTIGNETEDSTITQLPTRQATSAETINVTEIDATDNSTLIADNSTVSNATQQPIAESTQYLDQNNQTQEVTTPIADEMTTDSTYDNNDTIAIQNATSDISNSTVFPPSTFDYINQTDESLSNQTYANDTTISIDLSITSDHELVTHLQPSQNPSLATNGEDTTVATFNSQEQTMLPTLDKDLQATVDSTDSNLPATSTNGVTIATVDTDYRDITDKLLVTETTTVMKLTTHNHQQNSITTTGKNLTLTLYKMEKQSLCRS